MKLIKTLSLAALTVGALLSTSALAAYPEKPITLVCWSSAGSGHDLMARYIAKLGEKHLGQPITVVNKKGGKGKVAMSYVLNQKADGHVIMTNTRSMTQRLKKTGSSISIDNFKYISRVVKDPFVIAVAKDSPFNTLEELVTYAKANPNKIKIGGYSTNSVDEGLKNDLNQQAGINLKYIPYKGGKEPVVAVLGGHIDVAIANPSEMIANYDAGKLKVLAVASEERFAPFEQSPTLKEAGYNVVTEHWRGVMASNEVPNDVVEKLNDMIKKVVQEPEFKQFLASSKMYDGYLESEMFANLVVEQTVN
ncbi:Bug family tripartite tricarboxylate transporter substrate binding protein [Photobacterium rosenbergii]|uniref:Bug family tripartite tricarboxylate transporter substrate binding protein n=1 Tax=Photobacterium rosenbergii TaxID=294936 RepID=UPI001C99F627|nr:tripartite tricarboxylate transporter substrate binding protein [Photobacterium rosenbergii]MBY5945036.1 tripartite tricarboxylate transporter substrate binding protein [Photobacterium rosenbergii]